jgi:alkaline phosphatase D
VVAQSTLMAEADRKPGAEHGYWMDGWDGYAASRTRVIDVLATHAQRNALVVGGDMHAFYATDLRRDFADAMSPVVATEFVGGAITSQGASPATIANLLAKNPQLRYGRADKRGYGLLTLERAQCTVEFRMVDDEKVPSSAVRTLARFAVESGRPGVQASAT